MRMGWGELRGRRERTRGRGGGGATLELRAFLVVRLARGAQLAAQRLYASRRSGGRIWRHRVVAFLVPMLPFFFSHFYFLWGETKGARVVCDVKSESLCVHVERAACMTRLRCVCERAVEVANATTLFFLTVHIRARLARVC